jgi:hypothetical protein
MMMTQSQCRFALLIVFSSFLAVACRGVDREGGGQGRGELTLGITDGPIETALEVRLVLAGIEITPAGGSPILINDLREDSIDLLDLQGGEREEIIRGYDLDDGSYESVRLIVDETESMIRVESGNEYPLTIPAAELDKLTLQFDVVFNEDNDEEDYTIDIDLRKSIREDDTVNPPIYELHPRIRFVETSRTESLTGTVHQDLIEDNNCSSRNSNDDGNAIYLYRTGVSGEQDVQDNENDPYATAKVSFNSSSGQWEFAFGYLPVDSYKAVFTCNAILDKPKSDEQSLMDFTVPQTINLQQNNSETIRFE